MEAGLPSLRPHMQAPCPLKGACHAAPFYAGGSHSRDSLSVCNHSNCKTRAWPLPRSLFPSAYATAATGAPFFGHSMERPSGKARPSVPRMPMRCAAGPRGTSGGSLPLGLSDMPQHSVGCSGGLRSHPTAGQEDHSAHPFGAHMCTTNRDTAALPRCACIWLTPNTNTTARPRCACMLLTARCQSRA